MTIQNSSNPSFVITVDSKEVCALNNEAQKRCDKNPIGLSFYKVLHINNEISEVVSPVFFDNQWFLLEQNPIEWNGKPHLKINLHQRNNIPKDETLHHLKRMIGFLLHRIRSPLTGIQGYADLCKKKINQDHHYINQINEGVDKLFTILDELEILERIPLNQITTKNCSAKIHLTVKEVISQYSTKQQAKINFSAPSTPHTVPCNPGNLRRIISILIDNAIEHASAKDSQIFITLPAPNALKISHNGQSIPESVAQQVFLPFVTTNAQNLGIGLTMAYLYARRYRGSIFLTENNPFQKVSFTFLLPPSI